jgi:hypothetical protein
MKPFLKCERSYMHGTATCFETLTQKEFIMNIRTLIASTFILGAIGSSAFAANNSSFICGAGSTYDRDAVSCVTSKGAQSVTDSAGFTAQASNAVVKKSNIGDFLNETVEQRNERSSN